MASGEGRWLGLKCDFCFRTFCTENYYEVVGITFFLKDCYTPKVSISAFRKKKGQFFCLFVWSTS